MSETISNKSRSQEVASFWGKKKSWAPGHLTVVLSQVCLWLAYAILGNVSASVSSLACRELKSPWSGSQIEVSEHARACCVVWSAVKDKL